MGPEQEAQLVRFYELASISTGQLALTKAA
jgi:hypothetical protein